MKKTTVQILIFLSSLLFVGSFCWSKPTVVFVHGFITTGQLYNGVTSPLIEVLNWNGYKVLSANTPPIDNAEDHVKYLRAEINKFIPKEKEIILIGHSQGGLVARAYASQDYKLRKIVNVTTIGTPHRGVNASLINLADDLLKKIESKSFGLVKFLINSIQESLVDFKPSDFNTKYPDAPGVDYLSVVTETDKRKSFVPGIALLTKYLNKNGSKLNDGLVDFKSAAWNKVMYADGSVIRHSQDQEVKGPLIEADHLSQVFRIYHKNKVLPYKPARLIGEKLNLYYQGL